MPITIKNAGTTDQTVKIIDDVAYTEGDIDSTITGIPLLWEDASDTLRVPSSTKPLPVQQAALTSNDHVDIGTIGGLAPLRSLLLVSSSASTAHQYSPTIYNTFNRGMLIVMQIVASSNTGGIQPVIQVPLDQNATQWQNYHAPFAAVTTVKTGASGAYLYYIYPDIPDTDSAFQGIIKRALPSVFRVGFLNADLTSKTFIAYGWFLN